jgi:hypothetical protein
MADAASDPRTFGSQPWGAHGFDLARLARSIAPQIFVTVPVLSMLGMASEPALLNGLTPIDIETARSLAGISPSMTRILTDPESGRALATGVETYRPTASLRSFITARDATCRVAGCMAKATETDVDHSKDWFLGGETVPTNLASLCRGHHSAKTRGHFTAVQSAATGSIVWTGPTGRSVTSYPEQIPATVHRAKAFSPWDSLGTSPNMSESLPF